MFMIDKDNIIIDTSDDIQLYTEHYNQIGVKKDEVITYYPNMYTIIDQPLPPEIEIQKFKYKDGFFIVNESYIEPEPIPENMEV